jgi:cell division protein ZapD
MAAPGSSIASELVGESSDPGVMEFEQPLSERMRTFLRIEFLYRQAVYHGENLRDFSARAAVASLLEIMAILGRGDVRADVLKELERQATLLAAYGRQRGVDQQRLQKLLSDVNDLKIAIKDSGPNFMNALKDCEFLNTIKHRSSIPGGTCVFDLPDYAYWLRLPQAERAAQFGRWTRIIQPVCNAVSEIAWLVRETSEPVERLAGGGMYQHTMERNVQPNLVRVTIPRGVDFYPEISAGRHRVTVRFVKWHGVDLRPTQINQDIRFLFALS